MKKTISALTAFIMTASSLAASLPANAAGSNIFDDFESYADTDELLKAYSNNAKSQLSLAKNDGNAALRFDYAFGEQDYPGVKSSASPQDWSSFDGISFMMNSDGSGNLTTVQFVDANGVHWECTKALSDTSGWKEVEIAFSEFTPASGENTSAPDLSSVTGFSVFANQDTAQTTAPADTPEQSSVTTSTVPVVVNSDGSMHVAGGKLYDGDGNEFIMKGVNLPHDWYAGYTKTSIDAVADLGANTVRIVLGEGSKYTRTSADELADIINWSKSKGLVCILELHDFTGSDDPADITDKAVGYWKEMADLINANKDHVIVNIANEWQGTWNKGSLWSDTYCAAVKELRSAGLETAIMVDASGYGQETEPMERDCKKVLESDPDRNIIFSYHMYSVVGSTKETIVNAIDGITDQGVCLAIGEFGYWQNNMDVDERSLVDYCEEKDIGWLAWSWKGNGGIDVPLDMSEDWEGKKLTDWGAWVFGGKNGIQETAKLAYTLKGYDGEMINYSGDYVPSPGNPGNSSGNTAGGFTWAYPEASFEGTLNTDVSSDGVITINYENITDTVGAGVQTETRPGEGKGMDFSGKSGAKAVLTNKSDKDIHVTLVMKNGSDWLWAENGGSDVPGGNGGEMVIPAGKTVTVYYSFTQSTWKTASSGWTYTDKLSYLDDVRAIAFKVYAGSGDTASGSLEISDFEILGGTSEITTTASENAQEVTVTTTAENTSSGGNGKGMYISGNSLYTADGRKFIMRGMNIAHTWFKDYTLNAIDKSAEYGSNATRIVLADGTYAANGWQGTFDDASTVEALIRECRKNGQVAIVEYHNGTGGDDTKYVDQAVAYWLDMADMLNKYSDCCIVNILNEWQGTWNLPTYAPTYQKAIETLRNAGLKNVIMVDAPGWGQDAATMYNNASSILSADKDGNTMFSIHMYAVAGESSSKVKENIDNTLAKGVCLVIGEFGCNHMMSGQMYDVAYQTIMDYSQQKGVGWLAWSWCGNGSDDYFLDLVTDQSGSTLTTWGNSVVNGKNGIKETAVKLNYVPSYNKPASPETGTWYFDDIKLFRNVKGDATLDEKVTVSDIVAVLQYVCNKYKYPLSERALNNSDVYNTGDGLTAMDAYTIQTLEAGVIASLD